MTAELTRGTVAITGGSSGIGLALAQRLAAGGTRVAIMGRDAGRLEQAAARIYEVTPAARVIAEAGDAAYEGDTGRLLEAAAGQGDLIGFVACAGQTGGPFDALTDPLERWEATMRANLTSALIGCRAAAGRLQSGGAIVLVGSTASLRGSDVSVAYEVSKGGVISLARNLSRRLSCHRIRVNCVGPGSTDTPMNRASFVQKSGGDAATEAALRAATDARIPLGRLGAVDEVASVIVFLLSADAAYITGEHIVVDGGATVSFGRPAR
jgi:NAD(P)-dependent dehydrogenase (short-subunit alcohol dehydrogenase family)